MTRRRPFLAAVVGPRESYIIARDFGAQIEAKAQALIAVGQEEMGRGLLVAVAQLGEAGRQWFDAAAPGVTSALGSSEVPTRVGGSPLPQRLGGSGLETRVVAERLGVGERQVVHLIADERLSAIKVRGVWLVDEVSLAAEIERRRRTV